MKNAILALAFTAMAASTGCAYSGASALGADKVVNIQVDITPDDGIWTLRKLLGWRTAEASGVAVVVEDEAQP